MFLTELFQQLVESFGRVIRSTCFTFAAANVVTVLLATILVKRPR
jgi:hypothetical protein